MFLIMNSTAHKIRIPKIIAPKGIVIKNKVESIMVQSFLNELKLCDACGSTNVRYFILDSAVPLPSVKFKTETPGGME